MLDEAHKRGIAVMMDITPNCISKAHPIYVDASTNYGQSPYADWFILSEEKPSDHEHWRHGN